jgi:hypothetical protein
MSVCQRRLDSSLRRVRGSETRMPHPVEYKELRPARGGEAMCTEPGRWDVEFWQRFP